MMRRLIKVVPLTLLGMLLVLGVALMLSMGGCTSPISGDFLEGNDVDPNNPTTVTIDQLFTGIQVNGYRQQTGQLSRTVALWMQQMAGTDRQFLEIDKYVFTEDDYDDEFENWYTGGGLIDIRNMIALAAEEGSRVYAGYAKFFEAWFIGTCASIWGDIPYSEAVSDKATPKLDQQADVYNGVQAKLDEAIADLASGVGRGPRAVDLSYGGNTAKMIAAAHTLKARYYMHWAEVNASNYQNALNEANQGIASIADNMVSVHDAGVATEWNMWHQFYNERDSYTRAGKFMVDLLTARNDPRLTMYYNPDKNNQITGAGVAEPNPDVSELGDAFRSPGSPFPLITYEENELIKAECNFKSNDEAAALANLNNVRAAVAAKWAITYPPLTGLSGQALLNEILTEKYISLFLQIELWNDYKRNCFPVLQTYQGQPIPGRLYYSDDERNANPNIPPPVPGLRNGNDPAGCQ